MPLEKIDAVALASVVERCYDLSMDGRLDDSQRHAALTLAKRLRASLLNLLSARFEADAPGFQYANGRLRAVTARVQAEEERLDRITENLADLARLAGSLDRLVCGAAAFL